MLARVLLALILLHGTLARNSVAATLRLATFDIDATPPIKSLLAYDPVTNKWELGLRARGVVILGSGEPIVLCAIDWIGIANESHDVFCEALARAAGTKPNRVAVHTLHQHDAPESDFSAEALLKERGLSPMQYESTWQRKVLTELQDAIKESMTRARPFTHIGHGKGIVHEVASNRRIPGPDGKIKSVRWSATPDPKVRAEPEGQIDPEVSLVSFWNGEEPLAVLSFYATHPQSYYRTGLPNPDFPGLARFFRSLAVPGPLHVHFNGAGGNITAGKYNDGKPENRLLLAQRLAEGMRQAWENTKKLSVQDRDLAWKTVQVAVPGTPALPLNELEEKINKVDKVFLNQGGASKLAFTRRAAASHKTDIGLLALADTRILFMPGELFVEYQLAAKAQRPELFVCMASYGDYGPWYIGTKISYSEGGYETSASASNTGPDAEIVLMDAIKKLLGP
jgi:hypothetical protein